MNELQGSNKFLGLRAFDVGLVLIIYLYALPFVVPMFRSYFAPDHIFNLFWYSKLPYQEAVVSNLLFWRTYHRPLGALAYLWIYQCFGMNPLAYQILAVSIYVANVALIFLLALRLTRHSLTAALAAGLASVHEQFLDIWYNFGAIFELLAYGSMLLSFHLYLSCLESEEGRRRRQLYALSLAAYILAINSKEVAVVLPALLLLYELAFRIPFRRCVLSVAELAARLGPFFALAALLAAGKLLSTEALWRSHSFYQYDLQAIPRNLQNYVQRLVFDSVAVDGSTLVLTLAVTLGIALALGSRTMVFGWFYFLIALSPVIALPVPAGLYLYLPLAGVALYLAELIAIGLTWLSWRLTPGLAVDDRFVMAAQAALLVVLLGSLLWWRYDRFRSLAEERYLKAAAARASFAGQLFSSYPDVPERTVFLIRQSPFVDWTLQMVIWLHYRKPSITVITATQAGIDDYPALARQASQVHTLDFRNGRLMEVKNSRE